MKGIFLIAFILIAIKAFSQDLITTKDDSTFSVRIVEEEKKLVHFYHVNDSGRIIKTLPKRQVSKISYENISPTMNLIKITHDSLHNKDLFSSIVRFLLESSYEIESFNKDALIVGTAYKFDYRISAEIEDNTARFRGFITEKKEQYPSVSGSTMVYGKEKSPEEERVSAKTRTFKTIDKLCRFYLKNNKGMLAYEFEKE